MVFHLEPDLPYQPSTLAIAIVTKAPTSSRFDSRSTANARQPHSSVPSLPTQRKRIGEKRPQLLTVAIRNEADQVGLPWIGTMDCMTAMTEAPMR